MSVRCPMSTIFARLVAAYGCEPDKRGEVHVDCPWCGKPPQRGQVHFSFSEAGCYCFVCGNGGSLAKLAQAVGMIKDDRPIPAPPKKTKPAPPKPYFWQSETTLQYITRLPVEERHRRWQVYKPVTLEMVEAYNLGVGVLPFSRCKHERLLVPLLENGNLVGIRGRRIGCDCPKWLSPAGNRTVLYNADRIQAGKPVFIVENAVDALLFTAMIAIPAVATLSISYWKDEWLELLRPAGLVVVAYDNHLPGNGGGKSEWLATHPHDIEPAGIRLVNKLNAAGIKARLFDWKDAPVGTDIGDLLKNRAGANNALV